MKPIIILFSCFVLYFCSYRVIYKGYETWGNTVIEYSRDIQDIGDIMRIEKKIKEELGEGRIPDRIILIYLVKLGE